jgi:uncharacterized protein YukE
MANQIQAKPNMNGNTAKDFRDAGIDVHEIAHDVKARIQQIICEPLNGRNYQHDQTLRRADLDRVAKIYSALDDLLKIGEELFDAGEE